MSWSQRLVTLEASLTSQVQCHRACTYVQGYRMYDTACTVGQMWTVGCPLCTHMYTSLHCKLLTHLCITTSHWCTATPHVHTWLPPHMVHMFTLAYTTYLQKTEYGQPNTRIWLPRNRNLQRPCMWQTNSNNSCNTSCQYHTQSWRVQREIHCRILTLWKPRGSKSQNRKSYSAWRSTRWPAQQTHYCSQSA